MDNTPYRSWAKSKGPRATIRERHSTKRKETFSLSPEHIHTNLQSGSREGNQPERGLGYRCYSNQAFPALHRTGDLRELFGLNFLLILKRGDCGEDENLEPKLLPKRLTRTTPSIEVIFSGEGEKIIPLGRISGT